MSEFKKSLMIFMVRIFEAASALLAIISMVGILILLAESRPIPALLTWMVVFVISLFFWIFLSKIDKSSTLKVMELKNVTKTMTDVLKTISGGIALFAAFGSIWSFKFCAFPSTGFFVAIGVLIASLLLFLFTVGIHKPLYLLIIPAMIAPAAVELFLFRYEQGKGEVMIILMFISGIITSIIIRRYYAKRERRKERNLEKL